MLTLDRELLKPKVLHHRRHYVPSLCSHLPLDWVHRNIPHRSFLHHIQYHGSHILPDRMFGVAEYYRKGYKLPCHRDIAGFEEGNGRSFVHRKARCRPFWWVNQGIMVDEKKDDEECRCVQRKCCGGG